MASPLRGALSAVGPCCGCSGASNSVSGCKHVDSGLDVGFVLHPSALPSPLHTHTHTPRTQSAKIRAIPSPTHHLFHRRGYIRTPLRRCLWEALSTFTMLRPWCWDLAYALRPTAPWRRAGPSTCAGTLPDTSRRSISRQSSSKTGRGARSVQPRGGRRERRLHVTWRGSLSISNRDGEGSRAARMRAFPCDSTSLCSQGGAINANDAASIQMIETSCVSNTATLQACRDTGAGPRAVRGHEGGRGGDCAHTLE